MKTLRAVLLIGFVALFYEIVFPASAGNPAQHYTFPVAGDVFECEAESYTLTSGVVKVTEHTGGSQSGNTNFTVTFTPSKVVGEDSAGQDVMIRGAGWFGGTFNAQQITEEFTGTFKLQIVDAAGGILDSVNQTVHFTSVNGNIQEFDFGSCQAP